MTRVLVHIGLAVALVLAPALCCCKARGLAVAAHAAPTSVPVTQLPPLNHTCCAKVHSCCHEETEPPAGPNEPAPAPSPAPQSCACNAERPDAAQTESKLTVAAAEPTGELVPLPHAARDAFSEYCGDSRLLRSTGADAKSAALFDRHVMRC